MSATTPRVTFRQLSAAFLYRRRRRLIRAVCDNVSSITLWSSVITALQNRKPRSPVSTTIRDAVSYSSYNKRGRRYAITKGRVTTSRDSSVTSHDHVTRRFRETKTSATLREACDSSFTFPLCCRVSTPSCLLYVNECARAGGSELEPGSTFLFRGSRDACALSC